MVEKSLALATALTPIIGYEEAARIAQKASAQNQTIRQVAQKEGIFSKEEWNRLLEPRSMIAPVKTTRKKK
jgi:fumarate hydratase class II